MRGAAFTHAYRCATRSTPTGALVLLATIGAAAALTATPAWAAGVPTVSSVSPDEVGSGGGSIVAVHGTHFEEVSALHFGLVSATITTGTLTKGKCKVKSTTEIECSTPFHEHGRVHTTVTNSAGTSAATAADEITFALEVYKNEVAVGSSRVSAVSDGQLAVEIAGLHTAVECVSLGGGAAWNAGSPATGHGLVVGWSGESHFPTAENTELNSRCRFVYEGDDESEATSPSAWVTSEPPLHEVRQEGEVCIEQHKRELSECPKKANEAGAEREIVSVIRTVTRERSSLPWNVQFTEKSGAEHVQIGLPEECKGKSGAERTELSRCPEPAEREAGASPAGCDSAASSQPEGCVKVQLVATPPLNLRWELEGYLEPLNLDSGPNGLSPSSWEFEGSAHGEPGLHLQGEPSTEAAVIGTVKLFGYGSQELLSVK